jgi:hypothetical protein
MGCWTSIHDGSFLQLRYSTTTVKFGSQLSKQTKTVPQRRPIHVLLFAPRLTTTVRDNAHRTQDLKIQQTEPDPTSSNDQLRSLPSLWLLRKS